MGDNGKENGNYYNGLYRDYRVIWVVVKIMVPFWGTLNVRGRSIIGIQKGTIILTTTHIGDDIIKGVI